MSGGLSCSIKKEYMGTPKVKREGAKGEGKKNIGKGVGKEEVEMEGEGGWERE